MVLVYNVSYRYRGDLVVISLSEGSHDIGVDHSDFCREVIFLGLGVYVLIVMVVVLGFFLIV